MLQQLTRLWNYRTRLLCAGSEKRSEWIMFLLVAFRTKNSQTCTHLKTSLPYAPMIAIIRLKIASHVLQKTRRKMWFQAPAKVVWKSLAPVFPKIVQENAWRRIQILMNVKNVQKFLIAPLLSALVSITFQFGKNK